ncbi:MAG TPA: ABC transporter substrate-binding protein [Pseudonocardiaceae bacterium]|jgi:branched-chain amino acid transport system substrate-binding protein
MNKNPIIVVALAGLTLLTAGCGASNNAGSGGPAGEPIKIVSIIETDGPPGTPDFREGAVAINAAVKAVNAAGGIKGRPLRAKVCADKNNVNTAVQCARNAVSDRAVAVVGSFGQYGSQYLPILEAPGIPAVAPYAGVFEAKHASAYPIIGGNLGGPTGGVAVLADVARAKNITIAYVDVASAAAAVKQAIPVLAARGVAAPRMVPVPAGAPDMSSYAAAVLQNKPDGVYIAMAPADIDKLIMAIRQTGSKVAISRSGTSLSGTSLTTLGPAAEGILINAQFPPNSSSNPAIQEFITAMKAEDPSASLSDTAKNSWAAVMLFKQAAERATSIDPAGIKAALDSNTFDLKLLPEVQFKTPNPAVGADFPRAFNTRVTYLKVQGGELVSANNDQFIDPFSKPTA